MNPFHASRIFGTNNINCHYLCDVFKKTMPDTSPQCHDTGHTNSFFSIAYVNSVGKTLMHVMSTFGPPMVGPHLLLQMHAIGLSVVGEQGHHQKLM